MSSAINSVLCSIGLMLFVLCQINYYAFLMLLAYLFRPLFFCIITVIYTALLVLVGVFYTLCISIDTTDNTMTRSESGVISLQSHEVLDPEDRKYCYLCSKFIAVNTHHCRSCEKCTLGFDHHCTWMGCCIGERNYAQFISLVASLSAQLLVSLIAIITIMYMVFNNAIETIIANNGGINNWTLALSYMPAYIENRLREVQILIAIELCVYTILFMLLTHLLSFHVQLMLLKMSTYQYITGNGLAGHHPSITRSRSNAITRREGSGVDGTFASNSIDNLQEAKVERDGNPGFVSGPSPVLFDGARDVYGDIVRNSTPQ